MKPEPSQVLDEAMHLPQQARAYLAEKLLESLDKEPQPKLSDEWKEEIRRRCQEIDNGEARLIPAEEAFEEAYREIG